MSFATTVLPFLATTARARIITTYAISFLQKHKSFFKIKIGIITIDIVIDMEVAEEEVEVEAEVIQIRIIVK